MGNERRPSAIKSYVHDVISGYPSEDYLDSQKELESWKTIQDIISSPTKLDMIKAMSSEVSKNPVKQEDYSRELSSQAPDQYQLPNLLKDYFQKNKTSESPVEQSPYPSEYKDRLEKENIERNKLAPKVEDPSPWLQFGAHFGDALAGRGPAQTAQYFDNIREKNKLTNKEIELKDPNSTASKTFRATVEAMFSDIPPKYGAKWNLVSASDKDSIFRPLELQQKLDMVNAQLKNAQTVAKINQDGQNQRTNKQIEYKENHPSVGNGSGIVKNRDFEQLPQEDRAVVQSLSQKNASKIAIANQIDSVMSNWDNLPDDQKVTQGRSLLKTLNSTEGADAIGAEEANRLGSKLEFALGNFNNSNPIQFGRDLEGFKTQALDSSNAIKKAIEQNNKTISEMYARVGINKNPNVESNAPKNGQKQSPEAEAAARQKRIAELRAKAGK